MATIKLQKYDRKCKDTAGGIRKAFLFAYVQYAWFEIDTLGMELISYPTTEIYEFQCEGTYSQKSNVEGGSLYFEQDVVINLPRVYNEINLMDYLKQDLGVIVLTNNNEYLIAGAYNGLTGSAESNDGGGKTGFNGFKISLSGMEENPMLLIKDLESAGFVPSEVYSAKILLENDVNYVLQQNDGKINYK